MQSGVRAIIIATIISFALELAVGNELIGNLALWPLHDHFMPWQLVTYAFLHGNIIHLAFNMYGLWMFGSELERLLGHRPFLKLYFVSVLSAAFMQLLITSFTGSVYPTIGASGGVFGLLLAYGIFFPKRIIVLLIPPIPMPVWLFVILYAAIELTLGVTGTEAGVAHFAHLGGMIGSFLLIHYWLSRGHRD